VSGLDVGALAASPARDRPDLLAQPVLTALDQLAAAGVDVDRLVGVAEIDPGLADTAAFCEAYGVPLEQSANCVIVALRRGGESSLAAAVVLASTRADVNGTLRRHLGARKASFAPMETAVEASGMEYGGITPLGLPAAWPVIVDAAVAASARVVVGSGLRRSKVTLPGGLLGALPSATVLHGLAG
jgi:prolyl-tRNA editing enzyme YbaK/EbsC (Cys-tRNA(Pro) deacylase)